MRSEAKRMSGGASSLREQSRLIRGIGDDNELKTSTQSLPHPEILHTPQPCHRRRAARPFPFFRSLRTRSRSNVARAAARALVQRWTIQPTRPALRA